MNVACADDMLVCRLLVLLDRHTLRLLAGNFRLRQFNAALTLSLEQVADVAPHAVSALASNCSELLLKPSLYCKYVGCEML